MSAENRSVHTDALASLGTLELGENPGRDAIHLAVEPIVAGEELYPGVDVGIVNGRATQKVGKKLGIVDPFLKHPVQEGERFWLVVYPRQITSLRHVWSHPDFLDKNAGDEETAKLVADKLLGASEAWLRKWISEQDHAPDYADLIALGSGEDAGGFSNEGDYLLASGMDASGGIPIEVWKHVENITGKKCISSFFL